MIGPTSNLLQFSFFTSLVCFTDDPDWVELTGNEMISSAVIWQIKNLLLSPSPIWDSHHLAFGKNLSAPPLQIQTHKGGWDFSRSTKMQNLCFGIEFSFEQWHGAVLTGFLFPGRSHWLPWVHDCPLHHVQRVSRWQSERRQFLIQKLPQKKTWSKYSASLT